MGRDKSSHRGSSSGYGQASGRQRRVLFTGPPGAGKTTAIVALSDTNPLLVDVHNSDETLAKATTTVGMDRGEFRLSAEEELILIGTPGQERFSFVWNILAQGVDGIIILIDDTRPNPAADLEYYLAAFSKELARGAGVVGVGRIQKGDEESLAKYRDVLTANGHMLPLIAVDVRLRSDVITLIHQLLARCESFQVQESKG